MELSEESMIYTCRRKFLVSAGKNCFEPPRELKTRQQVRREHLQHSDPESPFFDERTAVHINATATPDAKNRRIKKNMMLKSIFANSPQQQQIQPNSSSVNFTGDDRLNGVKLRKAAEYVVNKITSVDQGVHHLSEFNRDDWEEEFRAGVHYWVNKMTGEVSSECPWKSVERQKVILNNAFNLKKVRVLKDLKSSKASASPMNRVNKKLGWDESFPYLVNGDEGTGSLVYDNKEIIELFSFLDEQSPTSQQQQLHLRPLQSRFPK